MPWAEEAVAYNDFAFLEKMWQDWSPSWAYPSEELQAIKDTFQKPGGLTAALNYYRRASRIQKDSQSLVRTRGRNTQK